VDLTWLADTLVALTPDRLMWRDPGTGKVTLGPLLGASLGSLHTVLAVGSGLIVAGDAGVGATSLEGVPVRRLRVPGDLPGRVLDIAVEGEYLWVAMEAGLARVSLEVLGR
jgi:ligand-binding sensor domain-containing protein